MKLLVIEDNPTTGKHLDTGLTEAGHEVVWLRDGKHGLEQALTRQYDAIVLDLMLPELSGMELLKELRARGHRTPVLLLTALGTVEERVAGLQAGADDYMVKNFAFPELLARLETITRRASTPSLVQEIGAIKLDLSNRRITCAQTELQLTPTEFSIMELLMRQKGQVVTRKMLCEHLWDADWEGTTNVIEVHINRLRTKLEKVGEQALIHTVRGRGYTLGAV